MRSIRFHRVLLVALLVSAPGLWAAEPVLEETAATARTDGSLLAMVVEQDGQEIVVADGDVVSLRRAPFTLWVIFTEPGGALMQVSTGRTVYDAIAPGKAFANALGPAIDRVMGMAELPYNADRSLLIDPYATHYLGNPRDNVEYRFNRVYHGPSWNDFVAGGRDVEFLADIGSPGRPKYRIGELPFDRIYVTTFASIYDKNYVPNILDYERVILEFVN